MSKSKSLEEREKQKYERMWSEVPSYRAFSPGYTSSYIFFDHFKERVKPDQTITDFGCGPGLAALPFLDHKLNVHLVDIAENSLQDKIEALTLFLPERIRFTQASLWEMPESIKPSEWIYCVDVLEHIPTEKVDDVLEALSKRTLLGGTLQICTVDEKFGEHIDDKLHLTVKPKEWWLEKIGKYWVIEESIDIVKGMRFSALLGKPIV